MPQVHGSNGKAPNLSLLTGDRFRQAVIRTLDAQAQAYGILQEQHRVQAEFTADLSVAVDALRGELKLVIERLDALKGQD